MPDMKSTASTRARGESKMSALAPSVLFTFPQSSFPPLAVGFFGLGTGYLIYGTQELLGYPKRDERVDFATGVWGLWMPGFMQFLAGTYLFLGLTLFGTFTASPALYMAALAFTAYGVHWFALGWIRLNGPTPGQYRHVHRIRADFDPGHHRLLQRWR